MSDVGDYNWFIKQKYFEIIKKKNNFRLILN